MTENQIRKGRVKKKGVEISTKGGESNLFHTFFSKRKGLFKMHFKLFYAILEHVFWPYFSTAKHWLPIFFTTKWLDFRKV